MFIYKLSSRNSNKIYIGQTIKSLSIRLTQHKSGTRVKVRDNKKLTYLYEWIIECNYNIEIELLKVCDSRKEMDIEEKRIIKEYKGKGFILVNSNSGGNGNRGIYGRNNIKSKKVLQYSLNGEFINEFNTLKEASEILGIKYNQISNCICLKRVSSGGGFIWKEWSQNYPLEIGNLKSIRKSHGAAKEVEQILNEEVIAIFKGRNKAAEAVKGNKSNILNAIKKGTKSYGYFWKFKNVIE